MSDPGRPRWSGVYSTRLTRYVLERDGYRCRWCGGVATTADHYPVARSAGGSDDPSNLIASCRPCNSSKGTNARPRQVTAPASRQW